MSESTSSSTALKPCPFCGSEELGSFSVDDPEIDENYEQVTCDRCDMMGPEALNREQSAAKWNARPEEDRLRSALQATERELDEAREKSRILIDAAATAGVMSMRRNLDQRRTFEQLIKERETAEQERDSDRAEAGRLAQHIVELTGKLALAEVEVERLRGPLLAILNGREDCRARGPACGNCCWCDAVQALEPKEVTGG